VKEKVMHLMRRGALTCVDDCSVRDVAQIMVVNSVRYCVILNTEHEVVGIISARSILKAFGKDLDKTKAKDILLPYTITITPLYPLKDALELMTRKKIEHLVVVSDRTGSKAVLGILHAADVVIKMAHT